jgi:hypothetical protein
MAEGAASLILEERENAIARGAKILAEVVGYATNADAYHITSPSPEGMGAAKCIQRCLGDGGLDPNEVDYINAHGTSTTQGDIAETLAIKRVCARRSFAGTVNASRSWRIYGEHRTYGPIGTGDTETKCGGSLSTHRISKPRAIEPRSGRGQRAINIVDQLADILAHHLVSDEHDDCDRGQDERVFCHSLALAETLAQFARAEVHPRDLFHP